MKKLTDNLTKEEKLKALQFAKESKLKSSIPWWGTHERFENDIISKDQIEFLFANKLIEKVTKVEGANHWRLNEKGEKVIDVLNQK